MEMDNAPKEVEDNFDFNFSGSDVPVMQQLEVESDSLLIGKKTGVAVLIVVLQTMEVYISLLPSILSHSSAEMLRILDDFVYWPSDCSVVTAGEALRAVDTEVLGCAIRLLRQATLSGSCKWFGSMEDNIKQMTQLIVSENWVSALKRSYLAKLALLCVVSNDKDIVSKAAGLFRAVLITSGMFDGHGGVDSELHGELQGWCDLLMRCGNRGALGDSLLLITAVMQFAFHWNGSLSSNFLTGFRCDSFLTQTKNFEDVLLPFSPVMYCFACLIGNNFSAFEAEQPKHVRCYIESISPPVDGLPRVKTSDECDKFFQKFRSGAALLAESLLVEAVFATASNVRQSVKYLNCFQEILSNISVGVEKPSSLSLKQEIANCQSLHELLWNVKNVRSVLLDISSSNLQHTKKKSHETVEFTFEGTKTFDAFYTNSRRDGENFSPSCLSAMLILHLSSIVGTPTFCAPSKELLSHPVYVFAQTHWYFLSLVHVTMCEPTHSVADVLNWVDRNWEVEALNKLEGMQERSLFFSRSLDILRVVSNRCVAQNDKLTKDVAKTPKKRSLSDSVQETSRTICENFSDKLCAKLMLMMKLFINNPQFWRSVQSSSLVVHFVNRDVFGQKCREILFVAALTAASLSAGVLLQQKGLWEYILELLCLSESDGLNDESVQSLKRAVIICIESPKSGGESRVEGADMDHSQLLQTAEIRYSQANVSPAVEAVAGFLQHSSFSNISMALKKYICSDWPESQGGDDGAHQTLGALAAPSFFVQRYCSLEGDQIEKPIFFSPLSAAEIPEALLDLFGELSGLDLVERVLRSRCPQVLTWSLFEGEGGNIGYSADSLKCYIVKLCTKCINLPLSLPNCSRLATERVDVDASHVIDCILTRLEIDMPHASALKATLSYFKLLSQSCDGGQHLLNTFLAIYVQSTPNGRRRAFSTGSFLSAINITVSFSFLNEREDQLQESWLLAFTAVLQFYLKSSSVAISDASRRGDKGESLELLLLRVRDLMLGAVSFNCQDFGRTTLANSMNKWVRSCLRHGFKHASVLSFLTSLIPVWNNLELSRKYVWFDLMGLPTIDDNFSSQNLLSMVVGHSMFQETLLDQSPAKDTTTRCLLLLLLSLVSHIHSRDIKHVVVFNQSQYLANVLLSGYSGTMSQNDRISLRILSILEFVGLSPPIRGAPLRLHRPIVLPVPMLGSRTSGWIFETFSPPAVYATLARFPIWRGVVPSQLSGEPDSELYVRQIEAGSVANEWVESSRNILTAQDGLLQCSEDVYDPCYFVPAIFHTLENHELSIRQLANCGGLSLILASLSSVCPTLRSYALASLQLVYGMLKRQTPEKDPAFRERSQILLLVGFVKNSFIGNQSGGAPEVSPTMGMFLGRAAMNLMQPNHKMFCKVNKYILSRAFCDPKDVPLFDLLVVNGDTQIDQPERLVVLRLIRDGLLTPADHINLCRKNAYNRLMLLFPLLVADTRVGHSILDILERGLVVRLSARYLLERCNLLAWLQSMASPVVNLKLTARFLHDKTPGVDHHNGAFSKYLIRYMRILRRLIWAVSLLAMEGDCTRWVADIRLVLSSIIEDVISACLNGHASLIPLDVFRLVVLCMWDVTLLEQELFITNRSWTVNMVERMSTVLNNLVLKSDLSELNDIHFSLLSLLSFKCSQEESLESSPALMCKFVELTTEILFPTTSLLENLNLVLIDKATTSLVGSVPEDTRKVEYFNSSRYKASVTETNTQEEWDCVWTTYARTDDNMNASLPSTLGRMFILSCYLQVMSRWSSVADVAPVSGSAAVARDLVIWNLFLDWHSPWIAESPQTHSMAWAVLSQGANFSDSSPVDAVLRRMMCVRLLQSVSRMRTEFLSWLSSDVCDSILSLFHDVAVTLRAVDGDSTSSTNLICRVIGHISVLISFHGRLASVDFSSKHGALDLDYSIRRVFASIAPINALLIKLRAHQLDVTDISKPTSFWRLVPGGFETFVGFRPDFGASLVSSQNFCGLSVANLVPLNVNLVEIVSDFTEACLHGSEEEEEEVEGSEEEEEEMDDDAILLGIEEDEISVESDLYL